MKLADVIAVLESAYPPKTAEKWDAVGLVCGDPDEEVTRVLVCVDPTQSTVDEAVEVGAQLVLAHHPLLLRGVNGVPADDPKGALVHKLIRNRAALYCAHTNADNASPGVSDALAEAIGLTVTGPLEVSDDVGSGRIGELPEAEPLENPLGDVASHLTGRDVVPPFVIEAYKHARDSGALIPLAIAMVIAAPAMEEFLFRGFLLPGLATARFGMPGAIALTSLAWASMHIQYEMFFIVQIFLFGLVLGWLRWRSCSLS